MENLLEVFSRFRMTPGPEDQFESTGKQKLLDRFSTFTDNGKPIKFVMLGYPMKSPNTRDKTLGTIPDRAEQVSLDNFKVFNDAVKSVYAPGIEVSIVSDGYAFNHLLQVPDSTVATYNEMSMDIAKDGPVSWYQLTDFFSKDLSLATMRDKVIMHFGITSDELERRILFDKDVNTLYKGMIRFVTADIAMYDFASNSQLHKQAKILARNMMFYNEAYSKLVQDQFKDSIRLSMHPSINNGVKYSFQLIPGQNTHHSPWHAALVTDGTGTFSTMHRKDADEAGFQLIYKDGRPYYYLNETT